MNKIKTKTELKLNKLCSSFLGTNYFQVAVHEFGHALGLGHSQDYRALMAPFYPGYQPNFKLHSDDIMAIQSRYGAPTVDRETTTAPIGVTYRPTPSAARPRTTFRPTQYPRKPSICEDMTLDAITIKLNNRREEVYGFRGDEYFRIDTRGFGIVKGYPRKISSDWYKLPGNLDAALYLDPIQKHNWQWNEARWEWVWVSEVERPAQNYFFKGSQVWQYVDGALSSGFPKPISSEFQGLPTDGNIDAAFVWNGNGHIYFIKGITP